MRAALEAVPEGQLEAGRCVGMNYVQIMYHVVLPQALRTAFPPLSNSLISMLKDTSLAAEITVADMFMAAQKIVGRTYEPLWLYAEVALVYLLFSTILSVIQRCWEKRLNVYNSKDSKIADTLAGEVL
jgi:cystine transport system permease protein